jgi:membrane protein
MNRNSETDASEPSGGRRGRLAWQPWQLPPLGWKDTVLRTWSNLLGHHTGLIAAGAAFYALLAIFPAIAAIVAIWGLVAEPYEVVNQIEGFAMILPDQAAKLIMDQATSASVRERQSLLTAIFAILFGIWSASKGANAVIDGLNVAYNEPETRGFVARLLLRVVFTFFGILGVLFAATLVVLLPAVLEGIGLPVRVELLIGAAKWVILGLGATIALACLYRYGPSRKFARWTWISPGALMGVLIWMIGSAGFSLYVSRFAAYNEMYGTLGGVVVLLMWLYLTCFVIMLGGELNAELERQTKKDTTTTPILPMGERGAYAADTLGRARS